MEERKVVTNSINRGDKQKPQKLKWYAFGCLTSVILLIVLLFSFFAGSAVLSRTKTTKIKDNSVLNIVISGAVQEFSKVDNSFLNLRPSLTAIEIIRRINNAAEDSAIDAILLEPRFLVTGYPVVNEIIEALENFKAKDKKVYAYLEMSSNGDYYLASVADEIFLNPSLSSGIYLSGVGVSSLYMRDLLDKLGIEMSVLHSGKYKGAGETYSRQTMSPELKESLDDLLDNLYDQLINNIADRRSLSREKVLSVYEKREDYLVNGQYAIDSGMVDALLTREQAIKQIGADHSRLLKLSDYKPKDKPSLKEDAIAIVYLQGAITMSTQDIVNFEDNITSKNVIKLFKQISENDKIKAVVLRVNSPGGSALESDIIYHEINKLKQIKPVIVSMSSYAASGGYYISAPADYIVADPFTLTGSIGVVAMMPNLHKMGKSIGTTSQMLYRGKYTNFMNVWEAPKEEDLSSFQRSIDRIYDEFIQRVSAGRGMSIPDVNKVAQGRIWISKRALESGLIDEIGSLHTALDKAAELIDVTDYDVMTYPKTQTLIEFLMEKRFNIGTLSKIGFANLMLEEEIRQGWFLYQNIKNDPVQFLSPVMKLEQ